MPTNNCVIIISSCDKYSDAWDPFFTLFFRYWPDCPLRLILISNCLEYKDQRVTSHRITKDLGWSSNLKNTLEKIEEKYILYLQEDYFLKKKVDNTLIEKALETIEKENAVYLRLYPCPGPSEEYNNDVGKISQKAPYKNSTQASIWKKDYLQKLLKDGENGWEFETGRALKEAQETQELFLSFKEPVIDYLATAIVKGRFVTEAKKLCKKEKILLNTKNIKMQSIWQRLKYAIKKCLKIFQKT